MKMNYLSIASKTLPLCFALLASGLAWAQPAYQKALQTRFIMAEDGETIELGKGSFQLSGTLWLDGKKDIVIRGEGTAATVLSFKGQATGAEGLKVTGSQNIVLENFTVQDAKGDAIKVQETQGIVFRGVKTEWTGKPSKKNGGYGLYPVNCTQVLIDGCEAIGASDAGIYVGQSQDIVVKNCKAWHNVAGIEIENSINAEVYDNEAYDNTGGILVFDLPGLIQKKGGNVKVHNNLIRNNNFKNFAPKGNIVAKVPAGTGILILATNNVEVYNNQLKGNNSVGTGIISYHMTEEPINDPDYYPYPTGIYIHHNTYERDAVRPPAKGRFGLMFRFKLKMGKQLADILYDGIVDGEALGPDGLPVPGKRLCIRENGKATFANMDAANGFKNISRDLAPHQCELVTGNASSHAEKP